MTMGSASRQEKDITQFHIDRPFQIGLSQLPLKTHSTLTQTHTPFPLAYKYVYTRLKSELLTKKGKDVRKMANESFSYSKQTYLL